MKLLDNNAGTTDNGPRTADHGLMATNLRLIIRYKYLNNEWQPVYELNF
jgi:hypothetical protein